MASLDPSLGSASNNTLTPAPTEPDNTDKKGLNPSVPTTPVKGLADSDKPSKLAIFQKLVVQEAKNRAEKGTKGAYNLSTQNTNDDQDNNNNVCIGGACDIYNSQGFKFNKIPGTVQSRGGNTTYEYNPNFQKDAQKQGFEVVKDSPKEGDMIQYVDEKGNAGHMNMVVGTNKDGKSIKVYNAYNQKVGHPPIYDQPITGDRTATAQDGKSDNFVVYRPTEAALKNVDINSPQVKQGLSNYDTHAKYEAAQNEFNGIKVGDNKKLVFIMKNGQEVKSNTSLDDYKKMDKPTKFNLIQSIIDNKNKNTK